MTTPSTRILLVDDDTIDAELTRQALLRCERNQYEIDDANSLVEVQRQCKQNRYDLVLLDLNLPETTGIETLHRLRLLIDDDVPVIVLTGMDDEETALELLGEGAADYLCKCDLRPEMLRRAIEYSLRRQTLLAELHAANQLLKERNARLANLYDTAQQFVDNVSHEFRTPLTVIREYSSIIRDGLDGPVTDKQCEHLEKILHRTDDLSLMVDDMLDISKLEAGLLAVWRRRCRADELIANVEGVIQARAASRNIQFTTAIESDLPDLYCDEEKARRVIINLAINAVKFTPEGGMVRLWARSRGKDIEIGVTDSGAGISRENLQEIFGRFRQVETGIHCSTKGFGLGLSIAKELVHLNLGQIDVQSNPGAGSTFSFTLPRYDLPEVVDRYLDRTLALLNDANEISLLEATIDDETASAATAVVDEYLQRALRGHDVALRSGDHRWFLAMLAPQHELSDAIARIEDDWKAFVRNCPAVELPQLQFREVGCFALPEQSAELRKAACRAVAPVASAGRAAAGDEATSPGESPRRVLIVDDNADVSACLSVRLEAAGYRVLTAHDGEAGLTAALTHLPDAVVLDVQMPKRDGLSVLRELRANAETSDTAIVMLSASVRDQHGALEAGANFFVQKPYESHEILTAIASSMTHETTAC